MIPLATALAVFVGSHFLLSSHTVRARLVARIGERPFLILYSAVAAIALGMIIWAYREAPHIELWIAPTAVKHITLSVMILVGMLAAAAVSRRNPAVAGRPAPDFAEGPRGIFRITRHPFNWGLALWALTHVAANGHAAAVLLFGSLAFLAIAGSAHIDARKALTAGAAWQTYAAQTSHFPFAAALQGRTRIVWSEIGWGPVVLGIVIYLVLLLLHEPVIGIAPMSWVSGIFG